MHSYDAITGGISQITSPEDMIQHSYDPATGQLTRTWTASNDSSYKSF